jgi:hypothetical protein
MYGYDFLDLALKYAHAARNEIKGSKKHLVDLYLRILLRHR